jgi:glycosyltransferase involved in cell wall biosynthesis
MLKVLGSDARHFSTAVNLASGEERSVLTLVDNASTDDTEDICRRFLRKDSRITFRRNKTNIGSAANFNAVFELSRGKYFMWAAHDDLWHPTYVRRCAEVLNQYNDIVLCGSEVNFIDELGHSIAHKKYNRLHTHGMDVRRRVRAVTETVGWFLFYRVLRPEVLRQTHRYRTAYGGDVILLMELLFHGSTFVLPERLFSYREIGKTSARYRMDITGVANVPTLFTPYTDLARNLLDVINQASIGSTAKAAMRSDLIENVCETNAYCRGQIIKEPPPIEDMPLYRRKGRVARGDNSETALRSRWLRKALYWISVLDRHLRPILPNMMFKTMRRLVLRACGWAAASRPRDR